LVKMRDGQHPIPAAALDDRLGFIGTSGSGKTYNAGSAVEIRCPANRASSSSTRWAYGGAYGCSPMAKPNRSSTSRSSAARMATCP
jgi:ABC-type dipeptide/oligopeptide/nickel transport system ATPase component